MHAYQFFVAPENITGNQVTLTGEEFHHCCRVLRFGAGAQFQVFDGSGRAWRVRLEKVARQSATGVIEEELPVNCHNNPITLGIGLTKSRALEEIVTTATVLGVQTIVPLNTRHAAYQNFKVERFRRVAIAALKQSGRTVMPQISCLRTLAEWLEMTRNCQLKVLAEQNSPENLNNLIRSGKRFTSIAAMVGPEGGFNTQELSHLKDAGFRVVNIFPARLRSELAVAMLLFYLNLLVDMED